VDGKGVGEVESVVLKDRFHLSKDGLVIVVLALAQATGDIVYGPDIVTRGVVSENASDTIMEDARQAVISAWREAGPEARKDAAEIKTVIRKALRRFFNKRLDRKPMIIPVMLEL
jgi:ribonuclease J